MMIPDSGLLFWPPCSVTARRSVLALLLIVASRPRRRERRIIAAGALPDNPVLPFRARASPISPVSGDWRRKHEHYVYNP